MKKHIWTDERIELLCSLYPQHLTSEVAKKMGMSVSAINNKAHKIGIKKDATHIARVLKITGQNLAENGHGHRFKKGQAPPNKGKKWDEFMSLEAQEKSLKTCFSKGHTPRNAKPEGTVVIRQYRNKPPYKMIKVPGEYILKPLHRHTWELANGMIPDGYNIIFKDRNTLNCELENLELVSNEGLMMMNTIHQYPRELKSAIRILSKLKKTIQNVKENNNE